MSGVIQVLNYSINEDEVVRVLC